MSNFAATLERQLDVVRDTLRVDPSRPDGLAEASSIDRLRSVGAGVHAKWVARDIENLVEAWASSASQIADRATALAESSPDSATAWTRSAFAQFAAGREHIASAHARRAIHEVQVAAGGSQVFDVPAVAGALRVLLSLGSLDDLDAILEGLPDDPQLLRLRASFASESGDIDRALRILLNAEDEGTLSLRGYLWLLKDDLPRAIGTLRAAIAANGVDVDAHFNLAIALNRAGSPKKALRSAGIASRLSPGRLDCEIFYLELLATNGHWSALEHDLRRLHGQGAPEVPELLIAEARLALRNDKTKVARDLLKRAERLAVERGDSTLANELHGNQVMMAYATHDIDRQVAKGEIQSTLVSAPESLLLADMLSMLITRRSEAVTLERFTTQHAESRHPLAFSLRSRAAFLQGRSEDCLAEVREWVKTYPNDHNGLMTLISVVGHLDDDWVAAARLARVAVRKLPMSGLLANQTAYNLALSGQPREAEEILALSPTWDHRLEATLGLVKISLGEVTLGLKHYRKAAEMVEKATGAEYDAVLMRIHQGMALRRLGLVTPENDQLLGAAALPAVSLPREWEDISSFVALKSVADRHGWLWPVMID